MLEKYIFFVSKQPSLIELSDIHQVVFSRVGSSMGAAAARTFDLRIVTKSGPEYTFSSINKEEHETTETYLKDKKIRIKNEMVPDADLLLAAAVDDDDDDMQSVSSENSVPRVKIPRGSDDDSETDGKQIFSGLANGAVLMHTSSQRISRRPLRTRAHQAKAILPMRVLQLRPMPVVTVI